YRMDYAELLKTHRDTSADITLAVQPVARAQASRLGIVRVGDGERIVEVVEKPKGADQLDGLRTPPEWLQRHGLAAELDYLANMGIYAIRREVVLDFLKSQQEARDLVTDIF